MQLRVLPDRLAIVRLPPTAPWPQPPSGNSFFAAVRTTDEISLVCIQDAAPEHVDARIEPDWRALEVAGPLDFGMVGVMAALTGPLSEVGVSVFVTSTFDTDYLLVRAESLDTTVASLRAAGHDIEAG
ncbi:MAG: uncharacterized protein QG597_554 [Actinomycetota bacterium]|nr:uncharacterized protein [Actinomycetota bacterium]